MIHFMIALLIILPGGNQDDCGNGLPCGPVPWRVPEFPPLESPTPMPTSWIAATPDPEATPEIGEPTWTPTATMTPTLTPSMTPTEYLNATQIYDGIGDLEDRLEATEEVIGIDGIEYSIDDLNEITSDGNTLFGYIVGLASINIGKLTPVLRFFIFVFGFVMVVKATTLTIPLFAVLIGLWRKIAQILIAAGQFIRGGGK